MKKSLEQTNFIRITLMLLAMLLLTVVSCSKEESAEDELSNTEVISATELQFSDEAEMISEEVTTVAEDVYAADEISMISKADYQSDYLPDCVTITTVVTDTTREKTIDFGEGCELPNGNVLSGIIQLSYAKDMETASKSIALTLENFTFNGVAVEGSADILRVRSNDNGNPQSTANASFNATWPEGDTASFTGTRTREWIEGYGSGFWGDNVFLITGKRTYVGRLGNVFIKEVITPLRREMACRFIVSGVLEISRNDNTASLDFGDGSCDAKGILTKPDGTETEIFLRRFLK
ncbi:hypothetical protein FVB32_00765 [Flagellimonas hymeniacidonis]|uniref:Lipoprotein n=1 Tax=Flagellimonas hymeniacidonis TaxID=2603628 RepID=A0A5C8V6T4_9FLAO|nr:hypothetical protein [Flagellimonas hymeniacidonis]TXN36849.1 hypothetical protein FVB32_00765 [Flagellimonas hymeniacidonis]